MRIIKTSAVIALSLLILSSYGFCHTSETTGQDERITVEFSGLQAESICCSWGQVSLSTTTVNTEIMVQNPHLHHLPLKVQCNIYLNDIEIVSGLGDDLEILPQASGSSVRFSSTLDNEKIIDWWVSHIDNGEKTTVRIEGKVMLCLDEVDIFYPYSEESEFETNMLKGLNGTNLGHIDKVVIKLGIDRLRSQWGKVTPAKTEIKHTLTIHNFGWFPAPTIITDVDYELTLNGTRMTKGSMGLPLGLWPGQRRSTTCTSKIDNRNIIKWWVSHISNGEKTKYCFKYTLLIKAFNGKLANWPSKTCGTFETKILPREK